MSTIQPRIQIFVNSWNLGPVWNRGITDVVAKSKSFVMAQIILELGVSCLGDVVKTSFYSKLLPVLFRGVQSFEQCSRRQQRQQLHEIFMNWPRDFFIVFF